jgi:FkbM family methyltransferase
MYIVSQTCQIKDLNSIYTKYFGYPSTGFFVEVGAFDGDTYSNTSCLADNGWKGIYIEPVEEYYAACLSRHKDNDVAVVQCAIGVHEGDADIFFGGCLTTCDPQQVKRYSEIEWTKNTPFIKGRCSQLRLDSLLIRHHVQPGFDILVVDVEGTENVVFDSFDIAKWKPKMMLVELEDEHGSFQKYENHVAAHKALRKDIISNGYVEIYKDEINTIFIREDLQK